MDYYSQYDAGDSPAGNNLVRPTYTPRGALLVDRKRNTIFSSKKEKAYNMVAVSSLGLKFSICLMGFGKAKPKKKNK